MARDWLKLAADAYTSSTSYVDSNYRKKWEDAINMFHSKHPTDSKYNTESYKHRSKLFRPKSRSMVRKHEAAAAAAFFSNVDVISTDAVDPGNPAQVASSAVMKEILNYRLTKTIPWFLVVVGGVQDAMTVGVVASYQYWKYKAKKTTEYQTQDDGSLLEVEASQVIEDKPCVELMPIENVRIDPGADWMDPVNSSPYLIRMIPMYMVDVRTMMDNTDDKTGQPKWKSLTDGQIRSAMKQPNDSTRQVREGNRQDSKDAGNAPISDFEIVWVHENFMRLDGDEMVYYTLGTEYLLTDAKPLKEVYFHGERPVVIGTSVIETHKIMPDSPVLMGEQLQREANEIVNQRMDNVKLVLNKRFIAKRGAQVDLKSLVRNVAGSITLANDPTGDVRELNFADVTSSSYAEQDRLNVDYDELTGNFSQGSVMTNRKMGETVGGMGMISGAANQLTEYTIRTITETWLEKVLRQLVKLEQAYETDAVILGIAAERSKLLQKYGIDQVTDELLNQELTLTINVGMGATDPNQKLQKFLGAVRTYAEVAQMAPPNVSMAEVGKEIFGLAGYKDGRRFMAAEEGQPDSAMLQQQMQQAGMMMQELQGQMQQLAQENEALKAEQGIKVAELQLKEREVGLKEQDLAIKAQDVGIKGYQAETQRLSAEAQAMTAQTPQAEPKEPAEPMEHAPQMDMASMLQAIASMQQPISITIPVTIDGKGASVKHGKATRQPDGSFLMESVETPADGMAC